RLADDAARSAWLRRSACEGAARRRGAGPAAPERRAARRPSAAPPRPLARRRPSLPHRLHRPRLYGSRPAGLAARLPPGSALGRRGVGRSLRDARAVQFAIASTNAATPKITQPTTTSP